MLKDQNENPLKSIQKAIHLCPGDCVLKCASDFCTNQKQNCCANKVFAFLGSFCYFVLPVCVLGRTPWMEILAVIVSSGLVNSTRWGKNPWVSWPVLKTWAICYFLSRRRDKYYFVCKKKVKYLFPRGSMPHQAEETYSSVLRIRIRNFLLQYAGYKL